MKRGFYYAAPIVALALFIIILTYLDSSNVRLSSGEFPPNIICKNIDCLLKCIRQVETGGEPNGGADAVGDKGRSHGHYQIQQGTIDYASKYDSFLSGVKATDLSGTTGKLTPDERKALSEKIMKANWAQVATANSDRREKNWLCEDLARVHNGGPSGHTKDSTKPYWDKVKDCMQKECPNDI